MRWRQALPLAAAAFGAGALLASLSPGGFTLAVVTLVLVLALIREIKF